MAKTRTKLEEELDVELAAGGVVLREGKVLVVQRPRYGDWSLPKGKREAGESLRETALREVREETGYQVEAGKFVGATSYAVEGRPKLVMFWRMEAAGNSEGKIDTSEVSRVEWWPITEATRKLTYASERDLLCRINEI